MAEIVSIDADRDVVALCRDLLRLAEQGAITGIACVYQSHEGETNNAFIGIAPKAALGELTILHAELVEFELYGEE